MKIVCSKICETYAKRESNQQAAKFGVVQAPAQKRESVIVIMVSYSISDMLQMVVRISETLTPTPKLNTVYTCFDSMCYNCYNLSGNQLLLTFEKAILSRCNSYATSILVWQL